MIQVYNVRKYSQIMRRIYLTSQIIQEIFWEREYGKIDKFLILSEYRTELWLKLED